MDMLRGRKRRARPMELGPPSPPDESHLGGVLPEHLWVSPIPDARVLPEDGDPAEIAVARDTVRLAFVTALQHLPARQRAVLILCEVLRWPAAETAELLDTSVAAVNSALQRARATLAALPDTARPRKVAADQAALLARYVSAFERYDMASLVTLLHEDAVQSMPPFAMWIQGARTSPPGWYPRGRASAGLPAAAGHGQWLPRVRAVPPRPAGGHKAWALQVLEISGDRIAGMHLFLDAENLFPSLRAPRPPPAPGLRTPGGHRHRRDR